jgi:excinuclease Cho
MSTTSPLQHAIAPADMAALPRSPGVYTFRGEGGLPLYIGKSVDIRSRVMSHLRAVDEVRMMSQTRRVDFIQTAGEIGALLLESRMINTQHPLFTQRLRRLRSLCSIRLQSTALGMSPEFVSSSSVNLGATPGLFGLFSSPRAAQSKLKELARQHMLCLCALGFETSAMRGCFGLQVKTCLGVCVGRESRAQHDARLLSALIDSQVEQWPFDGAIDLVEVAGTWVQKHRINNWCYLGTSCSKANSDSLPVFTQASDFDLDSYKILVKPIMLGSVTLQPVHA